MPRFKLELGRVEGNHKQMHGIQHWIQVNHFSFIKKDLLMQLYSYAFDYLIGHPKKVTAEDYQCFNTLINSDKERLEYCLLVINRISSAPHLQKIVATAAAYFSVFSTPMQINLSPAGKDQNQHYRNLKTLEFLKVYLCTRGDELKGRKKILLHSLYNYCNQRRLNANHFKIVNEAFNDSSLPNVLFCRSVVNNIDRLAHKTSVLKQPQGIRDNANNFYLQLTAPTISDRNKMTLILVLFSFAVSFYNSKFSAVTCLGMIAAGFALVFNQRWVDEQVDTELAKRKNIRLKGYTHGEMGNEFEPKISVLASEASHTVLGALSFFTSGLRVVNTNIQFEEAKLMVAEKKEDHEEMKLILEEKKEKVERKKITREEINREDLNIITQYGERSDSETDCNSDYGSENESGNESGNELSNQQNLRMQWT